MSMCTEEDLELPFEVQRFVFVGPVKTGDDWLLRVFNLHVLTFKDFQESLGVWEARSSRG